MNVSVGASSTLILYTDKETAARIGDRPLRASVAVKDGHLAIVFRPSETGPRLRNETSAGEMNTSFQLKQIAGWNRRCPRFRKQHVPASFGEGGELVVEVALQGLQAPVQRGPKAAARAAPAPVSCSDLRALVHSINDVKRQMGDELTLTISDDGLLRAGLSIS